ncbi:MAG: gamma-glutamyltransferase [Pirellulaceae bacterium]|nr:gamma-glutamyltransferase [Pirellulaceae bacterium]
MSPSSSHRAFSHRLDHNRRRFLQSSIGLATVGFLARPAIAQERTSKSATVASSKRGVVATVQPLASRAAIETFEQGGNAIDAAVAASLMLSVVDGHNSGIGGGCLALVRTSKGEVFAIDGRERAPLKATPGMFYRDGKPDPMLSQLGPLAAGVPGLIAALDELSSRSGRIGWRQALLGAARVAKEGFKIDVNYARNLQESAEELGKFAESKRILLNDSEKPPAAGSLLKQADLATTLTSIADGGAKWFYSGGFAEQLDRFMRDSGGLMTADDLVAYRAVERTPIKTNYRGHQVVGFPPPSSGGVHVAQMLGMLSHFDLKAIFADSPARGFHLLLEVMKRAMADRAHWLGDSDFVDVPLGLLDDEYLKNRASDIDLDKVLPVTSHGQPPNADTNLFGRQKHTTHLTTADQEGNVVAITQTVNTSFGCKMIVPGTGVILNNEMDDFSIAPGVRNAFGLVGSAANGVAPGKRPLSSMSPTIVLNDAGKPTLSCGVAGGPKIITTVLQILVRSLDLGQSIDAAIAAERVHHQWSPDQAVCENAVPDAVVQGLRERGHNITRIRSGAVAQGVAMAADGTLTAASDPRVPSAAFGLD